MEINEAIEALNKAYGKNSVIKLDDSIQLDIETFSSGSIGLDKALGGGIPKGRLIEILGSESGGKTSLAIHIMTEAQKLGSVAYIDAEHSFDSSYAKKIGLDINNVYFAQPTDAEEALTIIETLAKTDGIALIVLDSVAGLVPKAELGGDTGDAVIGKLAKLMAQHMRKVKGVANTNNCTIIYINQLRDKIGVMFGPTEITVGGKALKYFATIRLDVRKVGLLKEGTDVVGIKTRVKVIKNKVFLPFQEAVFEISHGRGINTLGEIFDVAVEANIVTKKGAWFSINGEQIGQGRINSIAYLKNNPEVLAKVKEQL